ncbi:DUF4214 domain-containing protein [Diplocloster agilis]|uniref:DUF4214 domain-containing protein n=1 Tax=Diplocloster agilis TaxID=2850323 RepID=A0A949K215_9FIRM|nr:DUF4214 domain-containing protein [Diplocloster agilis]MBU9738749.1 DUF4214 domain-containing protein [Diplocloster agilis]
MRKLLSYFWKIAICMCFVLLIQMPVYADEVIDEDQIDPQDLLNIEFDHYENESNPHPYSNLPFTKIDNIVIFVRFQDSSEYVNSTTAGYADMTYNSDETSLKNYLKRITYNELTITTSFYPNTAGSYSSVKVSHNSTYYKRQYVDSSTGLVTDGYTNEAERYSREVELITEIMTIVKPQLENSGLNLDYDNDGSIDGISFLFPTYAAGSLDHIEHNDLLWPHKITMSPGEIPVEVNGKYVCTYNVLNKGSMSTGIMGSNLRLSRVIVHEFMHTLGLPDLYRYYDMDAKPLGPWDIMDGGATYPANLTAYYQREYLGYGSKLKIYKETTENITLQAAEYLDPNENYAIIVESDRNPKERFVIENRQIEDGNQDTQKCSGLLVYRIMNDPNGPYDSEGNKSGSDFIFAFRPNESNVNVGDGDIGYAPVSPTNEKGFTTLGKTLGTENQGYDNKTIYYKDGSNSGIIIDNIRINTNNSITFDLSMPESLKGEGTQNNPYEIYTPNDLRMVTAGTANTYYQLMKDLDLSSVNFTTLDHFAGVLEGNGRIIKNLSVTGAFGAGLIDRVEAGAAIRNLNFENPIIHAENGYAGIFSDVSGLLQNIAVYGGNISSKSRAGGLAGILNEGKIIDSYTSATVTANHAGGLISYLNGGEIDSCFVQGAVNGSGQNPVTGAIFSYWVESLKSKVYNTYWDMLKTGQSANGKIFGNNKPSTLAGSYGLQIKTDTKFNVGDIGYPSLICSDHGVVPSGSWSVEDPKVLKCNTSTGVFTCLAAGTSLITYKFDIAGRMCQLNQNIIIESIPVSAIKLNNNKITLTKIGESYKLIASIQPSDATDKTVIWKSSAPATVSVSSSGTITAKGKGKALITATTRDGNKVAECDVLVEVPSPPVTPPVKYTPVEQFVIRLYQKIMDRNFDADGLSYWTNRLLNQQNTAAQVVERFMASDEFKQKNLTNKEYIEILYDVCLNRKYDSDGLVYWNKFLENGASRNYVLNGFIRSPEFAGICKNYGIERGTITLTEPRDQSINLTMFVSRLYREGLGRKIDVEGLNYHINEILSKRVSPVQTARNFILSQEFVNKQLSDDDYIKVLYRTYMGRDFDQDGLDYHKKRLHSGISRETLLINFSDSPEFKQIMSQFNL